MPTVPQLSNLPFTKKQIGIIGGVVVALIVVLYLIYANLRSGGPQNPAGALSIWGVAEKSELQGVFDAYQSVNREVEIRYQSFPRETYERTLLNALAAGSGPDIYMVRSRSLPKHRDKLSPLTFSEFPLVNFRNLYPTVVEQDFTIGGVVYALPLYIDTLALFYNRDLLDQGGVARVPETWEEFRTAVGKLRSLSPSGQIVRAGAGIGGSARTIAAAPDILSLLMIQNGAAMTSADLTSATFASQSTAGGGGLTALQFYVQFANAASPYFTWNDSQPRDADSFAAGKTAMIFGYQRDIASIRAKAPFLNFSVAAAPRLSEGVGSASYADYWGFGVSKQSRERQLSWNFLNTVLTDANIMRSYIIQTGRSPALRTLINENSNDPNLSVFVRQALTARSWYQADDEDISVILSQALSRVITGQATPVAALRSAEEQVTELMRQRRSQSF